MCFNIRKRFDKYVPVESLCKPYVRSVQRRAITSSVYLWMSTANPLKS